MLFKLLPPPVLAIIVGKIDKKHTDKPILGADNKVRDDDKVGDDNDNDCIEWVNFMVDIGALVIMGDGDDIAIIEHNERMTSLTQLLQTQP